MNEEAQAELERAVLVYPRFAAAWVQLGWLYEQQDRLEQAQTAFTQAQAADEKYVPAYIGLAAVSVHAERVRSIQPRLVEQILLRPLGQER